MSKNSQYVTWAWDGIFHKTKQVSSNVIGMSRANMPFGLISPYISLCLLERYCHMQSTHKMLRLKWIKLREIHLQEDIYLLSFTQKMHYESRQLPMVRRFSYLMKEILKLFENFFISTQRKDIHLWLTLNEKYMSHQEIWLKKWWKSGFLHILSAKGFSLRFFLYWCF
jgi:hypothetical protein